MHDGLVGLCCYCDCWLCAVDLERRIEDGEEEEEETAGRHVSCEGERGSTPQRWRNCLCHRSRLLSVFFSCPKQPKAEARLTSDGKLIPWHTSTLTGGATVLTSPIHAFILLPVATALTASNHKPSALPLMLAICLYK